MTRPRRAYLKLWREDPNGGDWAIINANLKFATFNVAITCAVAIIAIAAKIILTLAA